MVVSYGVEHFAIKLINSRSVSLRFDYGVTHEIYGVTYHSSACVRNIFVFHSLNLKSYLYLEKDNIMIENVCL